MSTRPAKERSPVLRETFEIERNEITRKHDQAVYVDECAIDRAAAIPKKGHTPIGVTPRQVKRFHRGKRL